MGHVYDEMGAGTPYETAVEAVVDSSGLHLEPFVHGVGERSSPSTRTSRSHGVLLRGTSTPRFALLDWSVLLRGANRNDAPGPPKAIVPRTWIRHELPIHENLSRSHGSTIVLSVWSA